MNREFTETGLESGKPYEFKYRAKNALGTSPWSDVTSIYAWAVPEQMDTAVTVNEGSNVKVTWKQPAGDGGSRITAFRVKVKDNEGEFIEETSMCDGSNESIYETMTCMIPMTIFTSSPWYLSVGASIVVAVEAINVKGYSDPSEENTEGAIVQSAPLVGPLLSRGGATNGQQVEVTWKELALVSENGGAVIENYQIEFCESEAVVQCQKEDLTPDQTSRIFLSEDGSNLVKGKTYYVRISARNLYGVGPFSPIAQILAAATPSSPPNI